MAEMRKTLQERPQGALPSNTEPNPRVDIKAITTRSGIVLDGPLVPPPLPSSKESPHSSELPSFSSSSSPFELPKRNPHQPPIPYPSRLIKEKLQDKSDIQVHKFFQMFKKLHFNISLAEALSLMPKYHKMLKELLSDKEKLLGLANTSLTENCSAILLKKLPEKLGDPKKLSLPDLTLTRMTLELATRSIAYPIGIAEDVCIQVGKFTFPADFIVVDYDVDPRVPLILGRPFLRTAHALVDVYGEELILRDDDEKLIFHADSTSKHTYKHRNESINMINFIDITCEDHFKEVDIDLLLEETDAFLSLDDSIPPDIDNGIYDSKGDILFLEELLNDEILRDLPPNELKDNEPITTKSLIKKTLRIDNEIYDSEEIFFFLKIWEPPDTFLMGDKEIKFNLFKDTDDPVPILRVSEILLDSLDPFLDSYDTSYTNPLFELGSEYTLNYDNPIFYIQNKHSDKPGTKTIRDEVHSTAQIPPLFEE
ncbi:reverse transcriptase domain-containing protein [Tanacetum coccineum]